ncbi:hypothetical protein [Sinorhizobium meliloti]|uniref:hypothetical protein n=1 Tax=Rhizobium meliloti TaxID=382 RepID=UPI000FDC9915|nr:hypothetical protein [Sinorhizobium meliloti]RVL37957.1 hypothetical protein CN148_11565 [Sinorhizobium meliloti]
MNKMVEKVARSIRRQSSIQEIGLDSDAFWEVDVWLAEAAIAAMREPTDEMIAAGDMPDCDNPQKDAEGVYRNMIDAALKE